MGSSGINWARRIAGWDRHMLGPEKRRRIRARPGALATAVLAAVSSASGQTLDRGEQWFVDNGLQGMGLIGNPSRGVPFHLTTYQSLGYTTQLWEWATDSTQLTTSWGRWVSDSTNMPPVGG